jgi:hypothetical protein
MPKLEKYISLDWIDGEPCIPLDEARFSDLQQNKERLYYKSVIAEFKKLIKNKRG